VIRKILKKKQKGRNHSNLHQVSYFQIKIDFYLKIFTVKIRTPKMTEYKASDEKKGGEEKKQEEKVPNDYPGMTPNEWAEMIRRTHHHAAQRIAALFQEGYLDEIPPEDDLDHDDVLQPMVVD
jgi:hypothetical protein